MKNFCFTMLLMTLMVGGLIAQNGKKSATKTKTVSKWSFTQRLRLGIKYHAWAGGFMADFNQSGKDNFTKTNNIGVFLRYEF